MESKVFCYGKYEYKYLLERSKRKTFSLVVMPNLNIILRVPLDSTEDQINKFLVNKWVWLKKQLNELERYKKNNVVKKYVSGESFYYLGRQYMLKVDKAVSDGVKVLPGVIIISTTKQVRDSQHNKFIYDQWYFAKCETVFKKELLSALKEYRIDIIPKIKVREMKSRWGSYQKNNTINLNPRLLQTSKASIHYVITHELCHIEYEEHNKDFYNLLESRIPDWRNIKDNLELRFG